MCFWGLGISVVSASFQKSNIGWPQQPPLERVQYISEKNEFLVIHSTKHDLFWSFWWDHQDQEVFLKKNWAVEASEDAEAAKVHEAAKVSKACKITSESFKVIKVLEFNNMRTYFDVLEKIFIDRIMKNPVEF